MAVFYWPAILVPQTISPPEIVSFSVSGGRTLTGTEQRVFIDTGFIVMGYNGIVLDSRAKAKAYDVALARMRRNDTYKLPIFDRYGTPGSDNDGASAQLKVKADLGATSVSISSTGILIEEGSWFNVGSRDFLHQVIEITNAPASIPAITPISGGGAWDDSAPWLDNTGIPGDYTVNILPPLRDDFGKATEVRFKDIVLRGRMADIRSGSREDEAPGWSTPSLSFQEDF
jgi:hypothetical protein